MLMADDTIERLVFGRNLRRARKLAGLNQTELAELLEGPVDQRTISRWERGHEPRIERRREIARALGQPLDFFYDESVLDD